MRPRSSLLGIVAQVIFALCCFAQADDANPERIQIGERWFSYEEAMPLLLEQLKGSSNEQKSRAAEILQCYGTSLVGTRAEERLLALVDEPVDFAVLDAKMQPYTDGEGDLPGEFTGKEQELAEKSDVKLQSLMALVMSGSERGLKRLQDLLTSQSATEQFIALEVKKERDKFGLWTKGKVPQRQPSPPVIVGTRRVAPSAGVKMIREEIDSGDRKRMRNALNALANYGYAMVVDDPRAADVLTRALVATRESAESDADVRGARRRFASQLLTSIDGLSPDRRKATLPFVEAASQDSDRYVAEAAGPVLQFLRLAAEPTPNVQ